MTLRFVESHIGSSGDGQWRSCRALCFMEIVDDVATCRLSARVSHSAFDLRRRERPGFGRRRGQRRRIRVGPKRRRSRWTHAGVDFHVDEFHRSHRRSGADRGDRPLADRHGLEGGRRRGVAGNRSGPCCGGCRRHRQRHGGGAGRRHCGRLGSDVEKRVARCGVGGWRRFRLADGLERTGGREIRRLRTWWRAPRVRSAGWHGAVR